MVRGSEMSCRRAPNLFVYEYGGVAVCEYGVAKVARSAWPTAYVKYVCGAWCGDVEPVPWVSTCRFGRPRLGPRRACVLFWVVVDCVGSCQVGLGGLYAQSW